MNLDLLVEVVLVVGGKGCAADSRGGRGGSLGPTWWFSSIDILLPVTSPRCAESKFRSRNSYKSKGVRGLEAMAYKWEMMT